MRTDESLNLKMTEDEIKSPAAAADENSAATPPVLPQPAREPRHVLNVWARDLGLSIVVSFFIITFLYQPVRVEGTSMVPQLEDQDRLFINKFTYHFSDINRGDVIVFRYPRDPEKSYIKRVIAVPGDVLRIDHGQVYVNGSLLKEDYVPRRFRDDRSFDESVIPPHEYFVMGDHRSISSDSRDFGPVERGLVYGKAAFVFWPSADIGVVR
jgi:signal peptidase I